MGHTEFRFPDLRSAVAVPSPLPIGGDEDAGLLQIGADWRISRDDCDRAYVRHDRLEDECPRGPVPEALYWRASDFHLFGSFRGAPCFHDGNKGRRHWYGCRDDIDRLTKWRVPNFAPESFAKTVNLRIAEILQADEAWLADYDRRSEECGLVAANAACDALNNEGRALRKRIIETPAKTLRGVLLKAEVFASCRDEVSAEIQREAEDDADDGNLTDMTVLLSLGADIVRMVEGERIPVTRRDRGFLD